MFCLSYLGCSFDLIDTGQNLSFSHISKMPRMVLNLQDKLNLVVRRNAKDIVVKELIHNLQKLRDKEKEKR